MSNIDRERLRRIKTFPSLLKYLRDELDWPIESDDFEDLTFEYEPEELGIDPKNAAKIDKIMQLRPLVSNQPWGIFFVKFEPKKLPVVVLRRILRELVMKKRSSANRADQAAWEPNDLLFISNYGEGDQRQITFAHFSENTQSSDLPTLKVLGWDVADTALHLDHVHDELHGKLSWPGDEEDLDGWRELWGSAFTLHHREVITTSKQLALRLADLAHDIRARVNAALAVELEKGPLRTLMAAFKESLIHDLKDDDFADMYAQTIAYGLLSARISRPAELVADNIADMVPITNPFLKELMETFLYLGGRRKSGKNSIGIDFDELGINDVVNLLREANMVAVLRDFDNKNPQEDPVIHFYELFLHAYDKKKKVDRGVFYTPKPVVSFIVRSVDEALRSELGLHDGLADVTTWGGMVERNPNLTIPKGVSHDQPFVQILDPATGTGTFLVEVIDLIHRTMIEKWTEAGHGAKRLAKLWNEYVSAHLLPRIHGYELMMAPYAIAHMKIGLKLFETGYIFGSEERARVYLTNALEPAHEIPSQADWVTKVPALAHEVQEVNTIKQGRPFTVIIGNPPYSKSSANRTPEAESFVEKYKIHVREEKNIQPLSDDYIKFLGYVHQRIVSSGFGIVSLITNRGYLVGVIHRGVRKQLQEDFNRIQICDLHGDTNVGESVPAGFSNDNVFDIQQGVAICILVRIPSKKHASFLYDVWGNREEKYRFLVSTFSSSIGWLECSPEERFFFFRERKIDPDAEIPSVGLDDLFLAHQGGIKTHRDALVIDFDLGDLQSKIHAFIEDTVEDEMSSARELLRNDTTLDQRFLRILYRPFDFRYIFYHPSVIDRPREEIMRHMLVGGNIGLIGVRQVPSGIFNHAFVTTELTEMKTASHDRGADLFPLYLYPKRNGPLFDGEASKALLAKSINIQHRYIEGFADSLGFKAVREGCGDLRSTLGPQDLFHYIYAILYSPTYRVKHRSALRVEFAKIPLSCISEVLIQLSAFGAELVSLHLMESPKLGDYITLPIGTCELRVEKVSYSDETVWINKAKTCGFQGVPEKVWNFHIGGYRVCEKWLKDRQAKGGKNPRTGRVLTNADVDHYQRIVVALNETIGIMQGIDEVIERHGGWPTAFQ